MRELPPLQVLLPAREPELLPVRISLPVQALLLEPELPPVQVLLPLQPAQSSVLRRRSPLPLLRYMQRRSL